MYKNEKLTKALLAKIDRAERLTLRGMHSGRTEHEPSITDRLLAHIENALDGEEIGGLAWEAKTLTSIGINSQETQHGADFFGVLNLRLPGYRVTKGFLAQAKRLEPGEPIYGSDRDRLVRQCERMLNRTPVSYVFVYSQMSGVRVASATDVLASDSSSPLELTTWSLRDFFRAHFECFIGDRRLQAATPAELDWLARDVGARSGIIISGAPDGEQPSLNRVR